jgi:hypothetical protein
LRISCIESEEEGVVEAKESIVEAIWITKNNTARWLDF